MDEDQAPVVNIKFVLTGIGKILAESDAIPAIAKARFHKKLRFLEEKFDTPGVNHSHLREAVCELLERVRDSQKLAPIGARLMVRFYATQEFLQLSAAGAERMHLLRLSNAREDEAAKRVALPSIDRR